MPGKATLRFLVPTATRRLSVKYPHLEPVGVETPDRAWRLAATDLLSAARLSADTDDTVASVLRHVEILRRMGRSTQGRDLLRTLSPEGADVPLVALAIGNTYWTQGNGTDAVGPYQEAERGYADIGDHDGVLAARIGLARSARISYSMEKRALLDAAIAAG